MGDEAAVETLVHTNQRVKAEVWRYDPTSAGVEKMLVSADFFFSATWQPEGDWLAYSTESGLYLLNLNEAAQGSAGPARIGSYAATEMDWR